MDDIRTIFDRELLRSKNQSQALTGQLDRVRQILSQEQEALDQRIQRQRARRMGVEK